MKNILVPTDFSPNAENALYFAMLLAQKVNGKITLFHAYQAAAPAGAVPFSVLQDETETLKQSALKNLKALGEKIKYAGNIPFDYIAKEGPATDTILRAIKEENQDMVVMGTKGATGLANVIFGSTASHVIEKASCPVMSIPEGFSFTKPLKKITYATDYHSSDLSAIKHVIEIARAFSAELNILHISGEDTLNEEELNESKQFIKKIGKNSGHTSLSFETIHALNIEEGLESYIASGATDMLVMATHKRTLLERIFGDSATRKMALNASIPLIAFHYNKNSSVKLFA